MKRQGGCSAKGGFWRTAEAARKAIARMMDAPRTRVIPTTVYPCDIHGGWHVSALPFPDKSVRRTPDMWGKVGRRRRKDRRS